MEILVKDQDAAMLTSGVLISITAICSMTLVYGCRTIPRKPIDHAAITKGVKARLVTVFGPIEDKQIRLGHRGANLVEQAVRVNNNLSIAPGYSDDSVNDKPS